MATGPYGTDLILGTTRETNVATMECPAKLQPAAARPGRAMYAYVPRCSCPTYKYIMVVVVARRPTRIYALSRLYYSPRLARHT